MQTTDDTMASSEQKSTTTDGHAAPAVQLSPSEKFFRYFQLEVTDLQEQMARISKHSLTGGERSDAIDHCLSGIARLSSEVQDASSYVPAYDQRTYGEAIKALNHKLQEVRQSHAPKPKFSFKSKSGAFFTAGKNASAISVNDAAELAHQEQLKAPPHLHDVSSGSSMPTTPVGSSTPAHESAVEGAAAMDGFPPATSIYSQSKSLDVSDHKCMHVVLPTTASHAISSGTVSNIRQCVVDLSQATADKPLAALYLKNIASSLIICGHVSGAIMMHNITDSVILVATRQFRMHDSTNCNVYLLATGRPIIENCDAICFAPLPQAYMLESDKQVDNKWSDVDDFKWLRGEQSPHWSMLAPEKRVVEQVWRDIALDGPKTSVQNALDAVNIPIQE